MKKTNPAYLILPLVLGLAACTKSYQPAQDALVVATSAQPLTLDPRFAMDATGGRISGLIFNSFVRVGQDFKILPEAAERWEVKGAHYKFYLRKDLQFHNGRKVLPEDLLYTWEFYLSSRSPFASDLKMVKGVSVAEENGQLIFNLELERELDSFLVGQLPAVKLLPKKEVLAAGDDFNQVLIGTGPFRFVHQKLNEIRLKSVSAKIDNLVIKIIRDDFTRYQKMLKGEVDIVQNELPLEKIGEFEKRPKDFQVKIYPGLSMVYLLINQQEPALKKLAVRIALAQSIDRKQIIEYKLRGQAREATSIVTPNNPYFNSELKSPAFDAKAAARLVEQAGAKGQTIVLKTTNLPAIVDIGRVLANQIQQTGLQVRHESYEWATYYDDIKKGNFQMAILSWVGITDPDIYRAAFHSKETPPGRNRGRYKNSEVDALLDQSQLEGHFAKRKKIFDKVQQLVHGDLAIISLWYPMQVSVAKASVRGYVPVMTSDYWPFTEVTKDR